MGRRRRGRGEWRRRQSATRTRRTRGALARKTPGARRPPGPAAWSWRRRGSLGPRRRCRPWPAHSPAQALPFRLPARRATLPLLPAGGSRASIPHPVRRWTHVPMPRPAHPGDGWSGEQVQLWVGRVLLLVLRGAAVLSVRGAADRGATAWCGALRRGGGARAFVLGALPGAGWSKRSLHQPRAPCRSGTVCTSRPCTDSLDRHHAYSESARFKVIVLR